MAKRLLVLLTATALVGGLLSVSAASAQDAPPAPVVPEVANIDDPLGDGNYLNDQGLAFIVGEQRDNTLPASVSTVGDILKVWFTNDATNLNVHIQTQVPPPATTNAIIFRVLVNGGGDFPEGCIWFEAMKAAPSYQGADSTTVEDVCAGDDPVAGTIATAEVEDGSGVTTLTFPIGAHPALAAGSVLTAPIATSRNMWGAEGVARLTAPQIDNTAPGTDYAITAGGPVVGEPPPSDPPPVDPPVKKGCKKGKGKKKGCKKAKRCRVFTPAEAGAEAPLTVVTDKATEEAPIEIPVETESGLPVASSHVFQNLQVDSKAKKAGLYVRYEFEAYEDLDLYLYNVDGSTAAQAAGFNPFPFIPGETDGTGTGGHSEIGVEQVDGVLTPDCGGYTADLAQFLGEGGERMLKVWLGPATWDPVAQAPIEQEDEGR